MLRFKEKRVVLFEPMCNEGHLHDFMYNPVLVNSSGKYTHRNIKPNHIHTYSSSTAQGGGGSFKKRKTIGEIDCCESGMSEQTG